MNRSSVQKYVEGCDESVHVTSFALTTLGYLITFTYGEDEEEFEELIQNKADIDDLVQRLKR